MKSINVTYRKVTENIDIASVLKRGWILWQFVFIFNYLFV